LAALARHGKFKAAVLNALRLSDDHWTFNPTGFEPVGAMMIERPLRVTLTATAMLVAFFLSEMLGAAAAGSRGDRGVGNYTYSDVLKPGGRARGNDDEHADAYVCDGDNAGNIGTPAFDACMRAHGWRFAHFEPAPASSNGGGVPDWAWTCPFANC
jgi:hypothetical protein